MKTKINKGFVTAEEKNDLYEAGYRYIVEGDYEILDTIDPWSGMPNISKNIYAFTDRAEAEDFAVTQVCPFNSNLHASVDELPEHTQTRAEALEEQAKMAAERKAKKEANEAKKATEAGMTVEAYKAECKRLARIKKVKNEIAALETELGQKKTLLKKLEG